MSKKSSKDEVFRTRHSSLEMPDAEVVKKKQDMLTKARNKILNLSDVLKTSRTNFDSDAQKKSRTQATLDYFFKSCPNKDKAQIYANSRCQRSEKRASLLKQNSVDSYPAKIEDKMNAISRLRPSTVCVDRIYDEGRETAALALERPRKKLSFREPEIMGYAIQINTDTLPRKDIKKMLTPEMKRSVSVTNGILHRTPSFDNNDLESQAMRVVRTVGQAFEVCHKLSITGPEPDHLDQDEQETLTQDLLSDRLSDIISDKPKKDVTTESTEKLSLPLDDHSSKDSNSENQKNNNLRTLQLDILPPPPNTNHKRSPLTPSEAYASPQSDGILSGGSGSGGSLSLPPAGSALSAHHEIQLLREQLEQQSQQTQAAVAQLQLAREQLAAEQSARLEAQARTHQLLVHNRELLDHIAALVAHLQGGEKSSNQQQTSPHVTMPQQQQQQQQYQMQNDVYLADHSDPGSLETSPAVFQALNLNPHGLIENRAVTSCLPSSPLRTNFNPAGTIFNFSYPAQDQSFETQLLQRLQALSGYTPPHYPYNYNQNMAFLQPNLYTQPLVNNNYNLQPPPQKKLPPSPLAMRHSYSSSPVTDNRPSPSRNNDSSQYQSQQNLNKQQQQHQMQHLQVQQPQQQTQSNPQSQSSTPSDRSEGQFIKPLSQMGTLTTTDPEGRVRVIVPVPSNADETGNLLASLRISDDFRHPNGPAITRSTSEKVPNRSELMSQVQRTAWARHTTK